MTPRRYWPVGETSRTDGWTVPILREPIVEDPGGSASDGPEVVAAAEGRTDATGRSAEMRAIGPDGMHTIRTCRSVSLRAVGRDSMRGLATTVENGACSGRHGWGDGGDA